MHQSWNSEDYARHGRFVAELAGEVVDWLAAAPGERILDLGCGDGALTERIARRSGAVLTGIDSSAQMVAAAVARGVRAQQVSAEDLTFVAEFDAVFSNAALHWVRDQRAALAGVYRALKPRGRFVAELGGHGNIAAIRTALRAVCSRYDVDAEAAGSNQFFTAQEYTRLLEESGFRVETIALAPRPTPLPGGMEDWLRTFRSGLLLQLPADEREAVVAETTALLRPILCDRAGKWIADYVRLRFRASRA